MGVKRKPNALSVQILTKIQCLIWMTLIVWAGLTGQPNPALGAPGPRPKDAKPTIVIDPGHGGHNQGAMGAEGLTEKSVCLSFAQKLASALEDQGYAAVLTRSADYDVPLRDRTAIANHQKADLFISIHTGASYLHSTTGIAIYDYQQPSTPASHEVPAPDASAAHMKSWQQIQLAHVTQSKDLAQTMAQTLAVVWPSTQIHVYQAPLVVLEGADMPAVLIEIGYLTNPSTEKNLGNPTYLATFAQTMARSINTYFSVAPRPQSEHD